MGNTAKKETRGRKRLYHSDRASTSLERMRRSLDLEYGIDDELNKAIQNIDIKRRKAAEKSLSLWVKTYGIPLLLNDAPPPLGEQVLNQMQHTINAHNKFMICMGRGSGKTSYTQLTALYAIATGKQKYVVIVSNNQRAANNILSDIFRVIQEPDTPFAQDYPEICKPFQLCNGGFRRRQTYNGISTDIQKNAAQIVLPRIKCQDGVELKTSGSVIACRGIGSGLRGMKHGTLRPDFAILDDLQDADAARNPESVEKLVETIKKDIEPLGGKERLSILQTATPIAPDDLVEKIKQDKSWTTTTFPAIITYPTKMELWSEYFRLYDEECVDNAGQNHDESLAYYKENFDAMNEGAQVFNPTRFSKNDGHLSAIQKLLELKHTLGDNVFESEYQMTPIQLKFFLPITPELVASKKSNLRELEIPSENVVWVSAATDINASKYLTTTIVAYMRDQSAHIIYHKFRKCSIKANIPEEQYYQQLYNLLGQHGKELKALNIRIDGWVIDGNGLNWNAVNDFCRNAYQICGLKAAAYVGRASHQFRSFMRTRLREEVNRTLLCGNEDEHRNAGTGRRYTFFDSDFYREKVQKGFLQEIGNVGSLSWYNGGDHAKWAVQVCAEKLMMKKEKSDGTTEYTWKDIGSDWDALDSLAMNLACYGSMGFSTGSTGITNMLKRQVIRKKIRLV